MVSKEEGIREMERWRDKKKEKGCREKQRGERWDGERSREEKGGMEREERQGDVETEEGCHEKYRGRKKMEEGRGEIGEERKEGWTWRKMKRGEWR